MFEREVEEDGQRHLVPSDLEQIPPGPYLAALLSGLDRTLLNGHDLTRVMQAHMRLVSHFEAELSADIANLAYAAPSLQDSMPEWRSSIDEFTSEELQAALHWTRRAADARLGLALDLRERLPGVWDALHSGSIDLPRARVLLRGTEHLSEAMAREVVGRILDSVSELTTGQIGVWLRRSCVDADPGDAKRRYETAREARHVVVEQSVDGTAELHAYGLPADRMMAIGAKIHGMAIGLNIKGETRTVDQLRADVLVGLLEGSGNKTRRRGTVDIRVPLTTLLELDEKSGEIPGFGPVVADISRQVVQAQSDSEWRFTVTGTRGEIVHVGSTRRRPTAGQKRLVEERSPTCVFPGCRMPARDSDIDHRIDWANGGQTTIENLAPLCRRHHRAKHQAPWDLGVNTDGSHVFTSQHGHSYEAVGRGPP